jgi:hypothetical protein
MAPTFIGRCEGETLDGTHDISAGDIRATSVGGASQFLIAGAVGNQVTLVCLHLPSEGLALH